MIWRNYILNPVQELTAAIADPITLQEAKDWLKITYAQDDDLIISLITSSVQLLQKGLNLSFGERELFVNIQHDGCTPIKLPYGPIISLDIVTYRNCDCVALPFVTADPGSYEFNGDRFKGVAGYYNITYTAGPTGNTEAIQTLVKQQLAYMYENRGDAIQVKINPDIVLETMPITNNDWI